MVYGFNKLFMSPTSNVCKEKADIVRILDTGTPVIHADISINDCKNISNYKL